ncbi:MAG: gluconokinase, partial [Rubrivivax sp.]|nr:gluconokinase [Rubrivivax sp.]
KSTIGRRLADAVGVHYIEGDALHSPRNIGLMAAGVPLTDADRHGWLQEVAGQLNNPTAHAQGVVVACSALKRAYRDLLRAGVPALRFVHLHGAPALLAQRLAARAGHFMPAALLQSQLDTLELPGADENAIVVGIDQPVDAIVDAVRQHL